MKNKHLRKYPFPEMFFNYVTSFKVIQLNLEVGSKDAKNKCFIFACCVYAGKCRL